MGRGRVQLRRIENKINRQVTFSKRRNGLKKKAYELAVLCDAEVALVIFSSRGKLYEYASHSMNKTLERYEKCSYAMQDAIVSDRDSKNWFQEITSLKNTYELLQRAQRQMMGDDLELLNAIELDRLEKALQKGLNNIRSRKTDVYFESIDELKTKMTYNYLLYIGDTKERVLQEVNKSLCKRFAESQNRNAMTGMEEPDNDNGCWESSVTNAVYALPPGQQSSSLHHVECEPTLQIGYHPVHADNVGQPHNGAQHHYMQGWWI